jgi:hypothetical protein
VSETGSRQTKAKNCWARKTLRLSATDAIVLCSHFSSAVVSEELRYQRCDSRIPASRRRVVGVAPDSRVTSSDAREIGERAFRGIGPINQNMARSYTGEQRQGGCVIDFKVRQSFGEPQGDRGAFFPLTNSHRFVIAYR